MKRKLGAADFFNSEDDSSEDENATKSKNELTGVVQTSSFLDLLLPPISKTITSEFACEDIRRRSAPVVPAKPDVLMPIVGLPMSTRRKSLPPGKNNHTETETAKKPIHKTEEKSNGVSTSSVNVSSLDKDCKVLKVNVDGRHSDETKVFVRSKQGDRTNSNINNKSSSGTGTTMSARDNSNRSTGQRDSSSKIPTGKETAADINEILRKRVADAELKRQKEENDKSKKTSSNQDRSELEVVSSPKLDSLRAEVYASLRTGSKNIHNKEMEKVTNGNRGNPVMTLPHAQATMPYMLTDEMGSMFPEMMRNQTIPYQIDSASKSPIILNSVSFGQSSRRSAVMQDRASLPTSNKKKRVRPKKKKRVDVQPEPKQNIVERNIDDSVDMEIDSEDEPVPNTLQEPRGKEAKVQDGGDSKDQTKESSERTIQSALYRRLEDYSSFDPDDYEEGEVIPDQDDDMAGVVIKIKNPTDLSRILSMKSFTIPKNTLPIMKRIVPGKTLIFFYSVREDQIRGIYESTERISASVDRRVWRARALNITQHDDLKHVMDRWVFSNDVLAISVAEVRLLLEMFGSQRT